MAEHPLRALIAWPLVLGVGLALTFLAVFTVISIIAFLAGLADQDIEADLGDEEVSADA